MAGNEGNEKIMRASHADRDQAIDRLKAAFVQGRLTKDELVTRAAQAFSARTYADLAALTADLPADLPAESAAVPSQPVPARPRRPVHPGIKVGAGVIALIAAVFMMLVVLMGVSVMPVVAFAFIAVVFGVSAAVVVSVPIVVVLKLEARRRNPLRARIRCNACQRRMHGITKRNRQGRPYSYYVCSHDPTNPRLAAQYPDHPRVTVREETISKAVAAFIAERLLGPDRKAMLAAALPADSAGQTARHAETAGHLRKQLARIDAADRALITELETAADPADPAAQAYRARIRARYAELYDERTRTETALQTAETAAIKADDPALLDELPLAGTLSAPPPTGSRKPSTPPSTSTPSTATTSTRPPSGPLSPRPPPPPSPP